ncbi:hypothetical protein V8C40DRAFT_237535 [Trichoderma camerunense]
MSTPSFALSKFALLVPCLAFYPLTLQRENPSISRANSRISKSTAAFPCPIPNPGALADGHPCVYDILVLVHTKMMEMHFTIPKRQMVSRPPPKRQTVFPYTRRALWKSFLVLPGSCNNSLIPYFLHLLLSIEIPISFWVRNFAASRNGPTGMSCHVMNDSYSDKTCVLSRQLCPLVCISVGMRVYIRCT